MRAWWTLMALAIVPLSGCFGPALSAGGVFAQWRLPEGDPAPVAMRDCNELLETLNARALDAAATNLDMSVRGWGGGVVFAMEEGTVDRMATADAAAPPSAGAQVTGTNNQEVGVDEADLVKTDGEWTYVIQDGFLYILRSPNVGDVQEHARIALDTHGGLLLLERRAASNPSDDRLVVILESFGYAAYGTRMADAAIWYGGPGTTTVRAYDLQDRRQPRVVSEHSFEGSVAGARLVDGTAYVVVHTPAAPLPLQTWAFPEEEDLERRGLTWEEYHELSSRQQERILRALAVEAKAENARIAEDLTLEDHLPALSERQKGALAPLPLDEAACRNVLATEAGNGRSVSSILALSVGAASIDSSLTQILGSSPIVYGAKDALVLAAPSRESWWFFGNPSFDEATDLQWFDLDGLDVRLRASGVAAGTVLDQFALDVHDGTLRVATTMGQWARGWLTEPEPMTNHVAVFEEEAGLLVPVGLVGPFALGERIWSARFTDDRAYIVTFEQIDPLWIIDLSDAANPRILGELEIPGVSTYIHPISDERLLTIGLGPAGPDGLGLDWGRLQVSLFDISDPQRPTRSGLLDLSPPGSSTWSMAIDEHKAFTYWGALGKLAIPMTTGQEVRVMTTDGGYSEYRHRTALALIDVDAQGGTLSLYGEVDQSGLRTDNPYGAEILRSHFLGFPPTGPVSVYAVSPLGVTAHNLWTLEPQGQVAFLSPNYR